MATLLVQDDIKYLQRQRPFLRKQHNETWVECIERNLKKRNFITRNECLNNYQTKLASRMSEIKQKGWKVEAFWLGNGKPSESKRTITGGDFVYWLKKAGKN